MTDAHPRTPPVVRFGDFTFDPSSGELVGPTGVALGDDAGRPRFIETLPKRGYRFLEPVLNERATTGASSLIQARSRRMTVSGRVFAGAAVVAVLALGMCAIWTVRRLPGPAANSVVVRPFSADSTDAMMVAYQRRLNDAILRDAGAERSLRLVTDGSKAAYVVSGSLKRQGNSVRIFVELILAHERRHLWADDMLDSYAFSGNSTLTADRIERNFVRVLQDTLSRR